MRIAEIYLSVQGEGLLSGKPSVFVRTSGCNLRCHFCDTPFTSWDPEGEDMSVEEIYSAVEEFDCEHVVLTGGEPMLYAELVPLCEKISDTGRHITIETAGTLSLPVACHLMSISPKLSNSTPKNGALRWTHRHEATRHAPTVIRDLTARYDHQLKFVVAEEADVTEVIAYLEEFPDIDRRRVMLMPEGISQDRLLSIGRWLEPLCTELGFSFLPPTSYRMVRCATRHVAQWFALGDVVRSADHDSRLKNLHLSVGNRCSPPPHVPRTAKKNAPRIVGRLDWLWRWLVPRQLSILGCSHCRPIAPSIGEYGPAERSDDIFQPSN